MLKRILKAANSLVTLVVACALWICGAYAVYALWDNSRVYSAAEDVQADMVKLKPKAEAVEEGPTFAELLAVNPDVRAWLTLDNTKIDYPILQGTDNYSYINTNVYGEFALAGSIFLDSHNSPDFSDAYSLLFGHHMEKSCMFGDLDLYKKKAFFDENKTGTLLTPGQGYDLEIFACLIVRASEENIFEPERWQTDINGLLDFVEGNALHLRRDTLDRLRKEEAPRVLSMTTCSGEFTDARTIVLAAMHPHGKAE